MIERLTTLAVTSSMLPTDPATREPRSFSEYDKVLKFRKLEVEDDVEAYLVHI